MDFENIKICNLRYFIYVIETNGGGGSATKIYLICTHLKIKIVFIFELIEQVLKITIILLCYNKLVISIVE